MNWGIRENSDRMKRLTIGLVKAQHHLLGRHRKIAVDNVNST